MLCLRVSLRLRRSSKSAQITGLVSWEKAGKKLYVDRSCVTFAVRGVVEMESAS